MVGVEDGDQLCELTDGLVVHLTEPFPVDVLDPELPLIVDRGVRQAVAVRECTERLLDARCGVAVGLDGALEAVTVELYEVDAL